MTKRGRPAFSDDQKRIRELEKEVEVLNAKVVKREDELETVNLLSPACRPHQSERPSWDVPTILFDVSKILP